jgi:hypothetical protein
MASLPGSGASAAPMILCQKRVYFAGVGLQVSSAPLYVWCCKDFYSHVGVAAGVSGYF